MDTTEYLVRFNLPIYQGGYVTSRTREAEKLYQAEKQLLEEKNRALDRSVRSAYLGILSAISRVEALNQSVASLMLALEARQEGFRSGVYTSLSVLDAERDLYLAKQDHALAQYDYVLNVLRLQKVAGSLGEADMELVSQWLD